MRSRLRGTARSLARVAKLRLRVKQPASAATAAAKPTWAIRSLTGANRRPDHALDAPRRRFRLPFVAQCCCAIGTAARCRAVGTRRSSTCIISARAKMEATTTRTTCSPCAARTTARVTAAICSSRRTLLAASVFGTQTGPRTADRQIRTRPMRRRRRFEAYETLALVNGKRVRPCVKPAPTWVVTAASSA